jgi:hypothetical protein
MDVVFLGLTGINRDKVPAYRPGKCDDTSQLPASTTCVSLKDRDLLSAVSCAVCWARNTRLYPLATNLSQHNSGETDGRVRRLEEHMHSRTYRAGKDTRLACS